MPFMSSVQFRSLIVRDEMCIVLFTFSVRTNCTVL